MNQSQKYPEQFAEQFADIAEQFADIADIAEQFADIADNCIILTKHNNCV